MFRKVVRAAPKLNILLGPDETSIQDSSADDHYAYHAGGGGRTYNESTLTEPPANRGHSLSNVHGYLATSRCRLPQRGDGGLYSDCSGRLSSVEMRNCGCSLASCPPPPPPPPASGSVSLARRYQDPASGLYAVRRSPVGPAADQRLKPTVYWQVSGRNDPPPCQQSFDKVPRRTNLVPDRHVIPGERDDVVTGNRAGDAEGVGSELDAASKPDKSPDLVLNGERRDQKLTGTGSNSSARTSGQDDRR